MVLAALSLLAGLATGARAGTSGGTSDWPAYGHDDSETRAVTGTGLSPREVSQGLHIRWRFQAPGGPVYGTPAVVGGRVYDADLLGDVFALDARSGRQLWLTHVGPVSAYPYQVTVSPLVTDVPVRTPAGILASGEVIVGDQSGKVWALDRDNGVPVWVTLPNPYGMPAIWGSAVLAPVRSGAGRHSLIVLGVASNEESFNTTSVQPCCFSRGSVVALDAGTGRVVWQTYMISPAEAAAGAAGAGIWSTPSFDATTNLVYVTTGNNYGNHDGAPATKTSDAFVALDGATGRIVWLNQRHPDDTYVLAYRPSPAHPDSDFGDSPKLFRLRDGRLAVAAGQKSGVMHVLDARGGKLLSQHQYLPPGGLGGFFASGAEVGGVIYANGNEWPRYLGGEIGGLIGAALDSPPPIAGDVVAVAVGPDGSQRQNWRFRVPGSPMLGAVAAGDGVVYVHANKQGRLWALDARTGRPLASVPVGPAISGPSLADGTVFIGYGDFSGLAGVDPTVGGVVAIGP